MKKLLIATDCFLPRWDGVASFLNELIPRIQEDFEITIIAPNFGELLPRYKAHIIRFPVYNVNMGDYKPATIKYNILREEIKKTDIVFVQSLGPIGIYSIILGKNLKKPVIRYNHTLEWELFPNAMTNEFLKVPVNTVVKFLSVMLYNKCSELIVPSAEQLELLNLMKIKTEKKIVHLGIDVKQYAPASKAVAKHEIGIEPTKKVIGYGGRLGLEKDLSTLYRAFMMLTKKHKDLILLIAGGGHQRMEKLFSGKENIILTGSKDNLTKYYQAMDIYVLPSLTETTSLTTLEAMACGLPVVVTPVGFIREYLNDGINGLLFPKKNSHSLYLKLDYLLKNPDVMEKLGKNARETVVNKFSWEKTAEGIKKIFNAHASP